MQAVILAAGRGTRMGELTREIPKPLLEVLGKPLLQYELESLPDGIDEVIIIVGYLGDMIRQRFGGTFEGKKLLYIEQDTLDGTAGALWRAKGILKDRFVVLMSDDIYGKDDVQRAASAEGWVLGVLATDNMYGKGKVETDSDGTIRRVVEGSHGDGYVGTNLFGLDTRVFEAELVPKSEGSDEYGLPQTLIPAAAKLHIPFKALVSSSWIQISSPEDLKKAEEALAI